jgi:hypothetical protein
VLFEFQQDDLMKRKRNSTIGRYLWFPFLSHMHTYGHVHEESGQQLLDSIVISWRTALPRPQHCPSNQVRSVCRVSVQI